MDPVEREKAGFKSRTRPTVSAKPSPDPAATVFVSNVSLLQACVWQILINLLFLNL